MGKPQRPESLKGYATERLLQAVQAVREACNEADRAICESGRTDLDRADRVYHVLVWAWANASIQVEGVMADAGRWAD